MQNSKKITRKLKKYSKIKLEYNYAPNLNNNRIKYAYIIKFNIKIYLNIHFNKKYNLYIQK